MTIPACRLCGHDQARDLEPSFVEGEHLCRSARACERRQREREKTDDHGGWGSSPKWPRRKAS